MFSANLFKPIVQRYRKPISLVIDAADIFPATIPKKLTVCSAVVYESAVMVFSLLDSDNNIELESAYEGLTMTIDARTLTDRITGDAAGAAFTGDSTKLQVDARELHANPQTWRDVDALMQDYNKQSADRHLPTLTISHQDGQTTIAETPNPESMASRLGNDAIAVAGTAGMFALVGSIVGPEGALIGGAIGGGIAAAGAVAFEVTKHDDQAVTVNSK